MNQEHAINFILTECTSVYNVSLGSLIGRSQTADIAIPRFIAAHLIRTELDMSVIAVGKIFNRDHTSITHASKRFHQITQKTIHAHRVQKIRKAFADHLETA
ncbi:helix-turn-helix domain-containing protein [Rubritalea sp.]|uniref:helix-turn-helix domain-containing protein n=1 Tax=Rubritalea sp. TaxID=2109375 RepID=UPI003EF44BD0